MNESGQTFQNTQTRLMRQDRIALLRDRIEHNRAVTVRIAAISVLASLALLTQHTLLPDDATPVGSTMWLAYSAVYGVGLVAGLTMVALFSAARRWKPARIRVPALASAGVFVFLLVALSIIDSGSETDIAALILGTVVVAAMYRARYRFYVGTIIAATVMYVGGHYLLWELVHVTGVITSAVVAIFSLYVASAMEGNRVAAFAVRRELDRSNRVLARLSSTDPLTGLLNRRTVDRHLGVHFDGFRRYAATFTVVMIDVDWFKGVNDTYGHDVGDEALVGVARVLNESLRTSDEIARYGGEEFLVVLPHTTAERAHEVAERLRSQIEAERFTSANLRVTASLGVGEVDDDDEDVRSLLRRADEALYRAKEAGRNRVIMAHHHRYEGRQSE